MQEAARNFLLAMWLLAASRGACVDSHPQCSDFAALGECESNAASMRTLCARSCDFCRDPAAPACHDRRQECPVWTRLGLCAPPPEPEVAEAADPLNAGAASGADGSSAAVAAEAEPSVEDAAAAAAAAAEKAEAAARQQRKSAVESTLGALAATAEKTELAAVQQALEAGEALLSRFAADRRIAERETELREAVAAARGRLDELRAARQRERDEKEAARKAAEVERKKAIAARKRAEKEEKEAEAAAIAATNAEVEKAVAEELRLRKAAERKAELDAFAVKVRKRWGERMGRVVCSTEEELTTSGVYNR